MTEKSTKYLSDILMAIELIEEFIVDNRHAVNECDLLLMFYEKFRYFYSC
jgi:hypothetical protein